MLVIENLTNRGLVKREDSREDRRAKVVQLTETGKRLIASLVEHHDQAVLEAMSLLNEKQLDTLTEITGALAGVGGVRREGMTNKWITSPAARVVRRIGLD